MYPFVILTILLAAGQDAGLLANPGFESAAGGLPVAWKSFVMPQPGAEATLDTENPCEGAYAVRLYNPKPYPSEPYNNWSQNLAVDLSGKKCRLSGYVKTQDVTGAALWVQCWRKNPLRVHHAATTESVAPLSGTVDWTRVEVDIDIPAETTFLIVRCVIRGQGTAWFDDVQLTESPPAEKSPEPQEGSEGKDEEETEAGQPEASPSPGQSGAISEEGAGPTQADAEGAAELTPQDVAQLKATLDTLREANQALAQQLNSVSQELGSLRHEIGARSASPVQEQSAAAEPQTRRRAPVLVPHGYVLEEGY